MTRPGPAGRTGFGGDPAGSVGTDAAARGDTVNVGVEQEMLSPAVQYREETDLRTQVAAVRGNRLKSSGAGGEQDFIQDRLVAQNQIIELFRNGENYVVVVDRQQFSLPACDPLCPGQILAFRTVTIATGVVGVSFFGAVAAFLPIASERGGTTRFDGMHQPELMEWQAMLFAVPGTVGAEDAGHLKGGPGHLELSGGGFLPGRAERLMNQRFLSARWFRLKLIEGADDSRNCARSYGGVPGGGVDSAVAEQDLDRLTQ